MALKRHICRVCNSSAQIKTFNSAIRLQLNYPTTTMHRGPFSIHPKSMSTLQYVQYLKNIKGEQGKMVNKPPIHKATIKEITINSQSKTGHAICKKIFPPSKLYCPSTRLNHIYFPHSRSSYFNKKTKSSQTKTINNLWLDP